MERKNIKKCISPRVRDDVRAFYTDMFDSPTEGAEFALEAFRYLYRRTLSELVGKFTKGELCLFIDVFNGMVLSPTMFGQLLETDVREGMVLELLHEKWKVSHDGILKKLGALTPMQIGCLEVWAKSFWVQVTKRGNKQKPNEDFLGLYTAQLADPEAQQ